MTFYEWVGQALGTSDDSVREKKKKGDNQLVKGVYSVEVVQI